MGMSPREAWERIKEMAMAASKIGAEAMIIRKRTEKLKPAATTGAAAHFAEQEREAQRLKSIGAPRTVS